MFTFFVNIFLITWFNTSIHQLSYQISSCKRIVQTFEIALSFVSIENIKIWIEMIWDRCHFLLFTTTVVTSRHAKSRNKDVTSWHVTTRRFKIFPTEELTFRPSERLNDRFYDWVSNFKPTVSPNDLPTDHSLPIASGGLTKRTIIDDK